VRRLKTLAELGGEPRLPACDACRAGASWQPRGGESTHPIYRAWAAMRNRVLPTATPKNRRRYHDRGIGVCPEWRDDYPAFRRWAVSAGWAEGLQLDRIDNDGPYAPVNCRWVPRLTNMMNREMSLRVTAWGEDRLLTEWLSDPRCGEGVDYHVVYDRLRRGRGKWSPERAISEPRRRMRNNARAPRGPRPA
jgi:hypothetical protein